MVRTATRSLVALAVLVSSLATIGAAVAATPSPTKTAAHHAAKRHARAAVATRVVAKSTVPAQGMRVFRDPVNGTLGGPVDASQRAELQSFPVQTIEPTVQHLADGSLMMVTDGLIEDYVVVQRDAKGHRVMRCVTDPRRLVTPAATPAQPEDR